MPEISSGGSGIIYLNTVAGTFRERFREANEVTKERKLESGKTIHEREVRGIAGKIIGFAVRKPRNENFGDQLIIIVEDETQRWQISTSVDGGYGIDFLRRIPNVNLHENVEIGAWQIEGDDGKKPCGIWMKQGGNKMKYAFDKDTPEMPPWEKVNLGGGKTSWNKDGQVKFLVKKLIDQFNNAGINGATVPSEYNDGNELKAQIKGAPEGEARNFAPVSENASKPAEEAKPAQQVQQQQTTTTEPNIGAEFEDEDDLPF